MNFTKHTKQPKIDVSQTTSKQRTKHIGTQNTVQKQYQHSQKSICQTSLTHSLIRVFVCDSAGHCIIDSDKVHVFEWETLRITDLKFLRDFAIQCIIDTGIVHVWECETLSIADMQCLCAILLEIA